MMLIKIYIKIIDCSIEYLSIHINCGIRLEHLNLKLCIERSNNIKFRINSKKNHLNFQKVLLVGK